MKYITLANLRSGAGRLIAAGIAVMISVAFIAAVMSLTDAWNRTMRTQAEGSAAGADLIVSPDPNATDYRDITPAIAKKLDAEARSVPAIAGTQPIAAKYADTTIGGQDAYFSAQATPLGRDLDIAEGSAPSGKRQIAVYQDVAKSMGLSVGQHIRVSLEGNDDTAGKQTAGPRHASLTVSGIARGSDGGQPILYSTQAGFAALPGSESIEGIRIVLTHTGDETAQQQAAHDLAQVLAKQRNTDVKDRGIKGLATAGFVVQTNKQVVDQQVKELTGGTVALEAVVLSFGVIALFVAALVIANTFQVIVASRTRTLALLRAIGATRGQIQRATLMEGLVLGLIGSAAGILLGWGAAAALSLAARAWFLPGFAVAALPAAAIIAGLAVGTVVTVLACIVPARKATRVTPIQALAPVHVTPAVTKFPLARTIIGSGLLLAGAAATTAGALVHSVLVALPAAIMAFCGILVLARVIVPPLVSGASRLLEKATHGGPVPGLLGRNVRLVPRRTASTASALLIGVTLVTTMMVGAQTVKTTSQSALVASNAVDLSVLQPGQKVDKVLKDSDIVTATGHLKGARVTVPQAAQDGEKFNATVLAATADGVKPARDSRMVPPRGTVWANPDEYPSDSGDDDTGDPKPNPSTATLKGKHGSVEVAVRFGPGVPAGTLLANPADLDPLRPTATQGAVWAKVADNASSADVSKLATALGDGENVDIVGAGMRADVSTIINIVLAIVLALLAASLVVAVVGVANTLSLSVMERKRETALLRAMGITRGQVASMVTLEAVLISIVAVVIGLGLGVFFSWAGISSLLEGEDFAIVVGLPWLQLTAVVAASLLAALLASVIPARAVNRTKPAQGLSA